MQESAAGDGNPLAEEPEQQVAAFVDGDEDKIDRQHRAAVTIGLEQKEQVENHPGSERPSCGGLPIFFEGFERWKARSERVRKIHGGAEQVRSGCGRGD